MSDDGGIGDHGYPPIGDDGDGGHRAANTEASGGAVEQSDSGALAAFQAAQQRALAYQQALLASAAQQHAFLAQQNALAGQYLGGFGYLGMSTMSGSPLFGMAQSYPPPVPYAPLPPPPPIEDAGISAGEIIGHRVWQVRHGLLQSMAAESIWAPGEPMVGKPGDGVGVHAFKSKSEALTQYWGHGRSTLFMAVGTVALWGEVIEHEKGYRAEFGKVLSIDMLLGMVWWVRGYHLRKLRERYGV